MPRAPRASQRAAPTFLRQSRWGVAAATLLAGLAASLGACSSGGGSGEGSEGDGSEPIPGVTHIRIDRQLDVGTQALLRRAIRHAEAHDHDTLIVEIDTPGGELEMMSRYAGMIREAADRGLLTVGWVSGEATSAGALVALACTQLYMAPSSTIGSATPVTIGPGGIAPVAEEGGVRAKILSYVRAKFRAVAEATGRPTALAEAMVDSQIEVRKVRIDGEVRFISGKEWNDLQRRRETPELLATVVSAGELLNATGSEATDYGLADGIAHSLDEVLAQVGKAGSKAIELERTRSEEALAFLEAIAPLLIGLGLMFGWFELKSPGFGLPGILSLACFGVLLVGRYFTGLADVPHIVLVVIGLGLVATELFLFPGTLWIGLVGGLCVLIGLVSVELGPGFDPRSGLDRRLALDAALQLVISAGVALVGVWILTRFLPDVPVLNRLVQTPALEGPGFAEALPEATDRHARLAEVGARGRVLTALRPVGKVVLDRDPSVEFEARAEGELIDEGTAVEVAEVHGGRLVVRPHTPVETPRGEDAGVPA